LEAIQNAKSHLESGYPGLEAARQLIDDSKDILAQSLDDQVCQSDFARLFLFMLPIFSSIIPP